MPKMKLLVLAQTPPPVHGQSVMVQALVAGLPGTGIEFEHINLRLSRSAADVGGWRPGKISAVVDACLHALAARFTRGCDTLYYVPAPGKRGALYRDWVVMLLCRPFFKRLVLHWHATGLGEWLKGSALAPERALTHWLLGRAGLSLVLGDGLRGDAQALAAKKIAVVPNGIADPAADAPPRRPREPEAPFAVLFLGLCCEEKGVFDAADAVLAANRRTGRTAFRLTAAGDFPDAATAERFAALAGANANAVRHAGFVQGAAKQQLLWESDCLCLPTRFPNEGQPLVLLEAMAADLPVVASRWRGIPEMLPPAAARLVAPGDQSALVEALLGMRQNPAPAGVARAHFLAHYTLERHLQRLAAALRDLA
jgi:glycosyltransferase involved in cell wall biosynthesis